MKLYHLKPIPRYLQVIFLGVFLQQLIPLNANNNDSKRVYIYSSYSYEQEWSTNLAKKLRAHLESIDSSLYVALDYVGADTRSSFLATRYGMQSVFYRNAVLPSVIVMIGDEAWMTYREMSLRGWGSVPVVLCCVNESILTPYIDFFKDGLKIDDNKLIPTSGSGNGVHFTGVFNSDNTRESIKMIQTLIPDLNKLVFISDNNYKDAFLEKQLKRTISEHYPSLPLEIMRDDNTNRDSIIQAISKLGSTDVLLVNNWYARVTKNRTTSDQINSFLLQSTVPPAFTFTDKGPTDTLIAGGFYPLVDDVVYQTSAIVQRVLKGEDPSEIPFSYVKNSFAVNKLAAQHHGVYAATKKLPNVHYFNLPVPFVIRNFKYVFVIAISLIIIVFICVLLYRDKRYRKEVTDMLEKYKLLYDEFITVYNNMPIGLVLIEKGGNIVRTNPTARVYKELIIENPDDIIGHISKIGLSEEAVTKLLNREPLDMVMNISASDYTGSIIKYYFRLLSKTLDSDMTLLIIIDISSLERERIKRERTRFLFEFAMNKSNLGVAEYNLLDRKGFATEAWYNNLRIEQVEDFSGIYRFINRADRIKINEFIESARQGKSSMFIDSIRVEYNKEVFWIRYVMKVTQYAPEKNIINIIDLNWNIDKQKKHELELKAALKKAKEAEILKNGFIANMSYEINTPLNSIIGFSDLLCSTEDESEKLTLIKHIEENNDTLLRLITDIIDLSKIESGTLDFKHSETDLKALLNEVVSMVETHVDKDKIDVIPEIKGEKHLIITDKVRLSQVISKFAANAVKYTEKGYIKIGYAVTGNQLYFFVTDTGCGMDMEKQRILLDNISNNKRLKGFGLGLQISKSIIQKLSGQMGFQSEEGVGSTFWFRIPIKTIEWSESVFKDDPDADEMVDLPDNSGYSILIVEEDQTNYSLISYILKGKFELFHAWNGYEAVEMFHRQDPSIIIMDLQLPGLSGTDTASEIRKISIDVPIFALTDPSTSREEHFSISDVFTGSISKPIQKDSLQTLLCTCLNHLNNK